VSIVAEIALAGAVAAAWLAALASWRLPPLARIHAVGFLNVAAGGLVTLAAWADEGPWARTAKILLIWLVLMLAGALSAHVTGRAIHLRGGDRR
jgi:multicomponent Na+:H+ antiporter subunit G